MIISKGAEYDNLKTLHDKILRKTSWITGELHVNQDFDLLSYLNNLGFFKQYEKNINNRLFMLNSGKLEIISQLSKRGIKALLII